MPGSPYTGDPTAVHTPDNGPQPTVAPTLQLPNSGDGDTALSVAQAFKTGADHIAWLKSPRAKAGSNVLNTWGDPIVKFMNARLQSRFVVDHLGFPSGWVHIFDEDWSNGSLSIGAAPDGGVFWSNSRWFTRDRSNGLVGVFKAIEAIHVGISNPYPTARLYQETGGHIAPSNVQNKYVETVMSPVVMDSAGNTVVSMYWDAAFNIHGISTSGASDPEDCIGMLVANGTSQRSSDNPIAADLPAAVGFFANSSSDFWQCYSKPNGGSATFTNSGVSCTAAGVRRRFRIDVMGAAVSDDSTARVNFFIDGASVARLSLDLTNGGSGVELKPFIKLWADGVNIGRSVGMVHFRAATIPGDVFV